MQQAIGQLTIVAIFFAMQSCEYLKVTQAKKQQTDILHLCNLQFFKDGKLIEHNDPHLKFSDCISITFKMQKKDKKNDTITQMASGDVNMCPVRMGAAIVRRIRSYCWKSGLYPLDCCCSSLVITPGTSLCTMGALDRIVVPKIKTKIVLTVGDYFKRVSYFSNAFQLLVIP
jgi:hypothetical protein